MKAFYQAIIKNKRLFNLAIKVILIFNGYYSYPFDFMETPPDILGMFITLYIYLVLGFIFAALFGHQLTHVVLTTLGLTAAGLGGRLYSLSWGNFSLGDILPSAVVFLIVTVLVVVGTYLIIPKFKLDQ